MAVGSARVTQPGGDFLHVRLSAHSGPSGENPGGSVRVSFKLPVLSSFPGGEGSLKGDVTCLHMTSLVPQEARVAARLREPFNGNTYVTLIVLDEGNPGHPYKGQSPDEAFIGHTSSPPPNCSLSGSSLFPGKAHGNIVVRNAA